jgi:hypothetical protein
MDHLQQREEHWAIVDLMGKGGHVRTVPVPDWVKSELGVWLAAAGIDRGRFFAAVWVLGGLYAFLCTASVTELATMLLQENSQPDFNLVWGHTLSWFP